MKKVLFFIVCLMMTGMAWAQKVGAGDAKEIAEDFLDIKSTRGGGNSDLKLSHTLMSLDGSNSADLYIFNSSAGDRFVIVAADERAGNLILGYGDDGSLDYDSAPDNLRWWLDEYAREIDYLRENVAEVRRTRSKAGMKARAGTVMVQPLLGGMKWNQHEPFNNLCPTVKGEKAVTGCIATAMAMVMNYHKWPMNGKGKHTDKHMTSETVDFSKSVYDWENMIDDYSDGYTQKQADAVAKLMYDCGVSVDMQFSSDGSGSYTTDVADALKAYFNYDSSVRYDFRDNLPDFEKVITDELKAKRPVLYSGVSDEGGHAFVCDGYMKNGQDNYFHFNFGWGGEGNGFFKTMEIDYKSNQLIVYGIRADNRTLVGDVYYNLISETAAQVTSPASGKSYSGRLEIPSSVTVGGKSHAVTKIGHAAFGNEQNLTDIVIPASVTEISASAFFGCTSLKSITVGWESWIPEPVAAAFDDEIFSGTELIVPDGMVGQYASMKPWMLFCSIKDNRGNKAEFNPWSKFGTGSGRYEYSLFFSGTYICDINARSYKSDTGKYQIMVKDWMENADLLIIYDKTTNKCMVPSQTTGYTVEYKVGDEVKTGEVWVADYPTFDPKGSTYDDYPCTYSPSTGIFKLNLVYYVTDGPLAYGEETIKMTGDQYKDYSVGISEKTKLVENSDMSATQKLNLTFGKEVAKYCYAVFSDHGLTENDIRKYSQGMADGTVESTIKTKGQINIINIQYPRPGRYAVVICTLDAGGAYHGDYTYLLAEYSSSKEWIDVAKGTYNATLFKTAKYQDLTLSRNIADPSLWKITDMFSGSVDFTFSWDESTDIVTFDDVNTGYTYGDYGEVSVADNHNCFSEGHQCYGDFSRFDRSADTFRFSFVYYVDAGTTTGWIGVETFSVPGLATLVQTPSVVRSLESGVRSESYNINGQAVGDSYRGIVIKDGKKVLVK